MYWPVMVSRVTRRLSCAWLKLIATSVVAIGIGLGILSVFTGGHAGRTASGMEDDRSWSPLLSAAIVTVAGLSALCIGVVGRAGARHRSRRVSNPNRQAALDHAAHSAWPEDCTNFVAHCLVAGGFTPQRADGEDSSRADALYDFIIRDLGVGDGGPRGREVGAQTLAPATDLSDPHALEHAGLQPGDIVIYRADGGVQMSHSALYVGKGRAKTPDGRRVYGDVVDHHPDAPARTYWALPGQMPEDKVVHHFIHLTYPGD